MQKASRFIFRDVHMDCDRSRIELKYRIEFPDGRFEDYTDSISAPGTLPDEWNAVPRDLLQSLLASMQYAVGSEYWKMYCPPQIEIEHGVLSPGQAAFWDTLYTRGLGEFFYRNKIDPTGLVKFPSEAKDYLPRACRVPCFSQRPS